MFDDCVAPIALSWNDNVLSAYCIAFAGERKRGRKQRDFAPKNAIHFVSKHSFQKVESDIPKSRTRFPIFRIRSWGGRDLMCISPRIKYHHSQIVFFDPNKFQEYFN